jgi:hypothetical protein
LSSNLDNRRTKTSPHSKIELIAIVASIPTALGGGSHGHAGIIVKSAKYLAMATVAFTNPTHSKIYPAGLATNALAGT